MASTASAERDRAEHQSGETLRVVSFDVGICNLACAVLDVRPVELRYKLDDWSIIKLREPKEKCSLHETTSRLIRQLAARFDSPAAPRIDVVLIENQPVMKNPVMKSIQMVLYSYFMVQAHARGWPTDVRLVAAASKLKVRHRAELPADSTPRRRQKTKRGGDAAADEAADAEHQQGQQAQAQSDRRKYATTKQLAVATARVYLGPTEGGGGAAQQDARWAAAFEASPKKDDLADALLHAVRFVEADLAGCRSALIAARRAPAPSAAPAPA